MTLTGQTGAIYCVAWSPDGDRIASTSGEGTVWIWDVSTGRAVERIRLHSRACHRVQWDPFHPKRLASVGADKRYIYIMYLINASVIFESRATENNQECPPPPSLPTRASMPCTHFVGSCVVHEP